MDGLSSIDGNSRHDLVAAMYDEKHSQEVMRCLSNRTLTELAVLNYLGPGMSISSQSIRCLTDSTSPTMARRLNEQGRGEEHTMLTAFALMAAATFSSATCLSEQEWKAAGLDPEEKKAVTCMTGHGADADMMVTAMLELDQDTMTKFEEITRTCYPGTRKTE